MKKMQTAYASFNDDALTGRLRFMQVDEAMRSTLREFWSHAQPALPGILDAFYSQVVSVPHLAQLVGNDVPRLKAAQGSHWQRLFEARFDDAYFNGVRTIGKVHNKIGLEPRWYIGAYNLVLGRLVDVAGTVYRRKPDRFAAAIRAATTAVMLDMDIAISVYQEDLLAERTKRQDEVMAAITAFDRDSAQMLETIMAAAVELESLARALSDGAQSTADRLGTIASASEQTATNVQSVAAATEQMSATIAEITRTVALSADTANQAVGQAERASGTIQGLNEIAEDIGAVVGLINDIAGQTNLLALNATIEAARAGSAGGGFAVVASEVKNLANQTAKATEEIRGQIETIQNSTAGAVRDVAEVASTIGQMRESTTMIAAAVEEQDATTKDISRNVQDASRGTGDVAENLSGTVAVANNVGAAASQVLSASGDLARQATQMRDALAAFFERIQAA
jgi:methyl-accepting chemotaxis protein